GTLTVTDVDSAASMEAQAYAVQVCLEFRRVPFRSWTYTMSSAQDALAAGQVVTETFTVASADGTSKPAAVTVTITGTNDAAVISTGATAISTPDVVQTRRAAISGKDADAGQASFVAQGATAGTYGTFTIDAAGNGGY